MKWNERIQTEPGLLNPSFRDHQFFHTKSGDFYLKSGGHMTFFLEQKYNFHADQRFFLSFFLSHTDSTEKIFS
jgi:hypothetical protein